MIRYIADTHFGHANVIKYDNRPFKDVEEMDAKMIELWNDHVADDDEVYVLGDVVWGGWKDWERIFGQLNGFINLVKGNHDKESTIQNITRKFDVRYMGEQVTIVDNDRHVVLNHCPVLCYPNNFRGWYHLYGHVHCSYDYNTILHTQKALEDLYCTKFNMFNVGAMHIGYFPRTLDEIEQIYKDKALIAENANYNFTENKNYALHGTSVSKAE